MFSPEQKRALWEALKEGGRLAFFAGLTALVAWGSQQLQLLDPTSYFYVIGTLVLRLADKFIHENEEVKANGIAPF